MSNVDSAKDSPSTIPVAENDGANTIEPLDLNQDHPESSEDSSQSQREMVKSRNNDVVEVNFLSEINFQIKLIGNFFANSRGEIW